MDKKTEKSLGLSKGIHDIFNVPDDAVLSADEIASMLRLNPETVRLWCRKGKLDSYSFGGKYVIVGSSFKMFMKAARNRGETEKSVINE